MNIAQAKEQIKDTVDGYLAVDDAGAYVIPTAAQRPMFLLGAPGIGKTAIISQVADELGIGLVSYSMTHHTRQSALGLPFIVERSYGSEHFQVSEYTMSEIIASVYDYMERTGHERGILFLDEINCVSETLYPSMLQFLQFKTFGRHQVPNGWIIVCAGNPPEYNKSVYDFDVVTMDRLRKISVEPDLQAWMDYARATGAHPAVMSYLEVKESHFYSIESTPSGKAFVTARGWDDLSRVMKLYEAQGKTVDADLISQFLQDEQIADRFAQYYLLFSKYRSDYQVTRILQGEDVAEVSQRAKAARFDERLALVRLLLDALDGGFARALEHERVVAMSRDALRSVKERIVGGESAVDVLGSLASVSREEADKRVSLGVASDAKVRPERLSADKLRAYAGACERERALEGPEAFDVVQRCYSGDVEALKSEVENASAALANAFAFVESVFGQGREMMAFVAELSGRPACAQFIGQFGSDDYYRFNSGALVSQGQNSLLERAGALDLDAAQQQAQEQLQQESGCGSCGSGCC